MVAISNEGLKSFAREILPLAEQLNDPMSLEHVHNIVVLVMGWSGGSEPTIDLDEYVGERLSIAKGKEDDGWVAEFKNKVEAVIAE